MKKILLTSTAVALALPLAQASAKVEGQTPRLQLSGELSPQFHVVKNKNREANKGKGFGQHLALEDSRINFDVLGSTDLLGGLEYGFLVGVAADTDQSNNVEEARISFKNQYGTVMIGDTRGVDDFMAVGPWKVMGGTGGGIYGNMTSSYQPTSGVRFSGDIHHTPKDATKINYITPRVAGFQIGVTYTPNSAHDGSAKLFSHTNGGRVTQHFFSAQPFDHSQVGVGVNYKNTFQNGLNAQASFTGLFGHTKFGKRFTPGETKVYLPSELNPGTVSEQDSGKIRNTKGFALGAMLGFQGWKIAGEYVNNGKSGEPHALKGNNAGRVYTAALGYSWNVSSVAAGYGHTVRKLGTGYNKAKADVYTLTYDHKFAPGFEGFIEGNFAKQKTDANYATFIKNVKLANDSFKATNDGVGNSNTKALIIGSRVRF
ncbi:MAG: porin [Candidatus Paracaedimonas acanthamoebae]|uniref:Porin n=1 Tax=Candidatus Paracaedimonas acanthamoebae TaxID=244581 RepID=A0A8J7PZL8_9PROT|nr:porin [Candidatus Paracaedimonas acanthamoebae]